MDNFLSSHFDSESAEYYPEDFQGAASGAGIIYISSDDEMKCASSASVDDLESLSDDDEVALLPECIERQMELPAVSENIPVPSSSSNQELTRAATRRPTYIPGPMFDAGYFDLGMGRGPVARDLRLRNDHPINICRQLVPMLDTPLSPPAVDKYPTGDWRVLAEASTSSNQQHASGIHFRGPSGSDNPYITGCTDCLFCGKSVEQIQDEAVIDYLHKTAIRGESPEQFNARRLAFLEGMTVGCFMPIPGEVSQAMYVPEYVFNLPCIQESTALHNPIKLKLTSKNCLHFFKKSCKSYILLYDMIYITQLHKELVYRR